MNVCKLLVSCFLGSHPLDPPSEAPNNIPPCWVCVSVWPQLSDGFSLVSPVPLCPPCLLSDSHSSGPPALWLPGNTVGGGGGEAREAGSQCPLETALVFLPPGAAWLGSEHHAEGQRQPSIAVAFSTWPEPDSGEEILEGREWGEVGQLVFPSRPKATWLLPWDRRGSKLSWIGLCAFQECELHFFLHLSSHCRNGRFTCWIFGLGIYFPSTHHVWGQCRHHLGLLEMQTSVPPQTCWTRIYILSEWPGNLYAHWESLIKYSTVNLEWQVWLTSGFMFQRLLPFCSQWCTVEQ